MSGQGVRTHILDMEECFVDDFLEGLPGLAVFEWDVVLSANGIFELDWLDFRSKSHEKDNEVIFGFLLCTDSNTSPLTRVESSGFADSFTDFLLVW